MEKEDVVESEYLKSLDNKTAQRYKEKIGIINNLDPYTLKRKELNENIELYPAVTYPDMVNYFLFAPSPLTSDELKCYKSLQSYNNFLQGWVQWIGVRQFAEKGISLLFGRVTIFFFKSELTKLPEFSDNYGRPKCCHVETVISGHDVVGLHTHNYRF